MRPSTVPGLPIILTLGTASKLPAIRLRAPAPTAKLVQTIADLAGKPWERLRILDLASLEGIFALEFASHGAQVVAIEGREQNNARARFAAEVLELSNVEFVTDDVRNLSENKYGRFDVVLCSGILYHLPGAEGCKFIRTIADVCSRLAIIDTHVALQEKSSFPWAGRTYHGMAYGEHSTKDTVAAKISRTCASLDNNESFWLTQPSLLNLLRDVGFSSVSEILRPKSFADFADRLTFAAIKGEAQRIAMSPELLRLAEPDWPEGSPLPPHPSQAPGTTLIGRIARACRKIGV